MLEEQDLEKIATIISKSNEKLLVDVVDSVSTLTDNLEKSLKNTEKSLKDTLADKDSVNRMMDQSVDRDQKLDKKVNTMSGFLGEKKILSASEIAQLHAIRVVNLSKQ